MLLAAARFQEPPAIPAISEDLLPAVREACHRVSPQIIKVLAAVEDIRSAKMAELCRTAIRNSFDGPTHSLATAMSQHNPLNKAWLFIGILPFAYGGYLVAKVGSGFIQSRRRGLRTAARLVDRTSQVSRGLAFLRRKVSKVIWKCSGHRRRRPITITEVVESRLRELSLGEKGSPKAPELNESRLKEVMPVFTANSKRTPSRTLAVELRKSACSDGSMKQPRIDDPSSGTNKTGPFKVSPICEDETGLQELPLVTRNKTSSEEPFSDDEDQPEQMDVREKEAFRRYGPAFRTSHFFDLPTTTNLVNRSPFIRLDLETPFKDHQVQDNGT